MNVYLLAGLVLLIMNATIVAAMSDTIRRFAQTWPTNSDRLIEFVGAISLIFVAGGCMPATTIYLIIKGVTPWIR